MAALTAELAGLDASLQALEAAMAAMTEAGPALAGKTAALAAANAEGEATYRMRKKVPLALTVSPAFVFRRGGPLTRLALCV